MKNVHRLICGALLVLFLGAIAWNAIPRFLASGEIITAEDMPFRSPMADLRGAGSNERFFTCQVSINGVMRRIVVPLTSVKIVAREDGQAITTISGKYRGYDLRNWLEATIHVPPEDVEMWEERFRFYDPDIPVRIDPELELR
ncbi:MAG: hypothetical protein HYT22_03085 [Candidatus Niyogibacteria bacterium]|nr:hypothetical protein [Candidatus Niyogibacteria bacterium]